MYEGKKDTDHRDEDGISDYMKSRLEHHNFDVRVRHDGRKGLKEAVAFAPDVVVLELVLDKMTGFTVCRKIREYAKLSKTKVVFLTAIASEDVESEAYSIGASAFLPKPYNPDRLLSTINDLLLTESSMEFENAYLYKSA